MVAHYLGHRRAGYLATGIERQVHFHPSSSLVSQNSSPEWIVYSEFIKTSRDFIKGITVIDEQWVEEAISNNNLGIDIEVVKKKEIRLIHKEEAGTILFKALVGPRYQNISILEETFAKLGLETVVVEAERDLGTLEVFSASPASDKVKEVFERHRDVVCQDIESREKEFPVTKKSGKDQGGSRVTLGQGGCVKTILLPGQSTKVLIKKAPETSSVDDLREAFSAYGEIKECFRFKGKDTWGMIRFSHYKEAENAVSGMKSNANISAVLFTTKSDHSYKQRQSQFQARLTWCRRPKKGKGTAFIKCPPLYQPFLVGRSILYGMNCEIKISEKGDDLIIFNAGASTEASIKAEVMQLLEGKVPNLENLEDEIRVSFSREKIDCPSPNELKRIEEYILHEFEMHLESTHSKCTIDLKVPKLQEVKQVGFVYFDNPVSGLQACQRLQGYLKMNGQTVEISPKLKTSIHVPRSIMNAIKEKFDKIIVGLKKYKGTEVTLTNLKQGDFRLDICSQEAQCIVEAREILQTLLEGEVIECGRSTLLECLLLKQGLDAIHSIEKAENVLIFVNHREKQLHIYGSDKEVSKAQMGINAYLSRLVDGREECVSLKGPTRPPGLMKLLLLQYGQTLEGLQEEFGLNNIKVDFKLQKLSLVGKVEALDDCIANIEELSKVLEQCSNTSSSSTQDMPECVVCCCPVENGSDLYRLEACGHGYCYVCIEQQALVSVRDKLFPLTCAKEGCGKMLVWKDFEFFIGKKWVESDKLVQMSLTAFVEKHPDRYKFCPTPNCPDVYEVNLDPNGSVHTCQSCFASICSSCSKAPHQGLTCRMSSSMDDAEAKLDAWVRGDSSKRKICPGCKSPIEKIEGCNKMHCASCDTIFCWICLEKFDSERKCYDHLTANHGGCFD